MDVGVADAAEQDFDGDVVWLRLAPLDGHGGERFTGCCYAPGGYLLHLGGSRLAKASDGSRGYGGDCLGETHENWMGYSGHLHNAFLVGQWPRFLRVSLRAARRHSTNARRAGEACRRCG